MNAQRQSVPMISRIAGYLAAAILLTSCASLPPPQTVPSVDLARYAGSWHEIESFPNWFQGGCTKTKAEYSPLPDGRIRVVNTCERSGRPVRIEGTARVVPGSNNSKLKVRFFWPFEGDFWILARQKTLDPETLAGIRSRLAAKDYDVSRLRPTPLSEQN
jgi:apolipoprotein D and lipocalin family protein